MCFLALVGYFAFPTYPTYDSFYALLWGRDVLHLHMPDFSVYRGPTEHPLAIAFGAFCFRGFGLSWLIWRLCKKGTVNGRINQGVH